MFLLILNILSVGCADSVLSYSICCPVFFEYSICWWLSIWDVILPIDELIFFRGVVTGLFFIIITGVVIIFLIACITSVNYCTWIMIAFVIIYNITADWWFGTCFIFHNTWDNPSYWRTHIFQDGYCTTNQQGYWKITMLPMGKSTIVTGSFSIAKSNKLPEGVYGYLPTTNWFSYLSEG